MTEKKIIIPEPGDLMDALNEHGSGDGLKNECAGIPEITKPKQASKIYIPNGEVRINGNVTVQLTAPAEVPDPSPAIPGILIYAPASNHEEIQINGSSNSYFQGTVLAPGADCNMLGNGATDAYRTQMICWNVEVGGTADTYVLYDDVNQYSKPTSLDLQK